MNKINTKRFGLACGFTGGLLYFSCALIMLVLGHDATVKFFNTLLHGLDVSAIIKMNISLAEMLLGFVLTFILSWLIGACIALIYNVSLK
jgi:hypothetical protein